MSEKEKYIFNMSVPVVMTFPNLFEARKIGPKGKESGAPKFSANFLMVESSEDFFAFKALAGKAAKERWPGRDLRADLLAGKFQLPFTAGNKLADIHKAKGKESEFNRGFMVVSARSIYAPRLSILENGAPKDLDDTSKLLHKDKFYSGSQALASFNLKAYEGVGANPDGVCAYIGMVLTLNKGARVGSSGGPSASEVFKGYVGSNSDADPYAGQEDSF